MPATRSGWVTLVGVLYEISGFFNVLIGLVALGVTLSGSATVDKVYIGDWPTHHLVAAAIVLMILAGLQIVFGAGIIRRERWAWIAGLVISSLVILENIFYFRLLDEWAVGGLFINIGILLILALKQDEFHPRARPAA
jgi:hypothetical protein